MTGNDGLRSVVVTGAGRGLGQGIALAFGGAGFDVIIAARGENGLETENLVRARGGSAKWVRCDVTKLADVRAAVSAALERNGRLDGIIHNAASQNRAVTKNLETVGIDVWEEEAAVQLRGSYHCAIAAREALIASSGRYVLCTSPSGMEGTPKMPFHSVVTGAMRGFVKSLAREWGPLGVRVTALSPLALTPAMKTSFAQSPGHEERLRSIVPLRYIGDPEADLAPVFEFLISDASRYITGQTLVVDGGRFMNL